MPKKCLSPSFALFLFSLTHSFLLNEYFLRDADLPMLLLASQALLSISVSFLRFSLPLFTCSFSLSPFCSPRDCAHSLNKSCKGFAFPSLDSRMGGRISQREAHETLRMKVRCFPLGSRTRKVMLERPLSFSHLNCIQKKRERKRGRERERGGRKGIQSWCCC